MSRLNFACLSEERTGMWKVWETDRKRQTAARIRVTSKRLFDSVIISETSKLILSGGKGGVTRLLQSLAGARSFLPGAFAWWFISKSRGTNVFKCPAGRRWALHGSGASRKWKYSCKRPRQRWMRRMRLDLLEIKGPDVVCTMRAVRKWDANFPSPGQTRRDYRKSWLYLVSHDETRRCAPVFWGAKIYE